MNKWPELGSKKSRLNGRLGGASRAGAYVTRFGFPRLGCWQVGCRDAQQLAEPFGILPSIGRDEHLRFGTRIRRRVRHRFGMGTA